MKFHLYFLQYQKRHNMKQVDPKNCQVFLRNCKFFFWLTSNNTLFVYCFSRGTIDIILSHFFIQNRYIMLKTTDILIGNIYEPAKFM
jgi:hypothetical protein